MAASLLARLALYAAAASVVTEAAQVELREGCRALLRGIGSSQRTDAEVAMECRARLPPGLCRARLAELGAQPWSEDKIGAACDAATRDIELSIEALPRDLQDAAYQEMNAQVEQCMAAKKNLAEHPIRVDGKPVPIRLGDYTVDATLVAKILQSMKMSDLVSKYHACQETNCTPTTTLLPPDDMAFLWAGLAKDARKKESPLYVPPPPVEAAPTTSGRAGSPPPQGTDAPKKDSPSPSPAPTTRTTTNTTTSDSPPKPAAEAPKKDGPKHAPPPPEKAASEKFDERRAGGALRRGAALAAPSWRALVGGGLAMAAAAAFVARRSRRGRAAPVSHDPARSLLVAHEDAQDLE